MRQLGRRPGLDREVANDAQAVGVRQGAEELDSECGIGLFLQVEHVPQPVSQATPDQGIVCRLGEVAAAEEGLACGRMLTAPGGDRIEHADDRDDQQDIRPAGEVAEAEKGSDDRQHTRHDRRDQAHVDGQRERHSQVERESHEDHPATFGSTANREVPAHPGDDEDPALDDQRLELAEDVLPPARPPRPPGA